MPCDFDFDIKKKDWRPKCVADIVNELSRAFCTPVALEELDIQGTDYMQKKPVKNDADLKEWLKTESKTYEKLIKLKIPKRIIADDWAPKKDRILCKGQMLAKYYGDEEVSTRQVQFTLKLHDCGFFRLKQTLPGSGASPYWVIFEGKWARTSRGFRMEFCVRYPYQKAKKHEFDLAFEAMPEDHDTTLAFLDEREAQINGMLPAIVGTDAFSWVELCQEHDTENNPKARFNEEDDDVVKPAADDDKSPADDAPASSSSKKSAAAPTRSADQPTRAPPPTPEPEDDEPVWPLYLGLALFLAIFLGFSWMQWGVEMPKLKPPREEEF